MKLETLTELLTKHAGARKDGAYHLVGDVDLTFFIAMEGETLGVPRITRLEIGPLILAETHKGERYAFAVEDVRAVKIDKVDASKRDGRSAGFGKSG